MDITVVLLGPVSQPMKLHAMCVETRLILGYGNFSKKRNLSQILNEYNSVNSHRIT